MFCFHDFAMVIIFKYDTNFLIGLGEYKANLARFGQSLDKLEAGKSSINDFKQLLLK